MKIITLVTENFAELYGITSKTKRNRFIKEQVGRLKVFEKTDYFFLTNPIQDFDSLSKQEKNIFGDLLMNTPHKKDILKFYNENIANGGKIEDKKALFKQLNTICQFLKAHPYNDLAFGSEVLKKTINWGFSKKQHDIDLLKTSFNLYIDKKSISNLLDSDEEIKMMAREQLTQSEQIYKKKEKKDTILPGCSGLITLGLAGAYNNEISSTAIGFTKWIAENIHATPLIPLISSLVPIAAGGFILYQSWKTLNKSFKKYVDIYRNDSITVTPVEEYQQVTPMQNILAQRTFKEVLHDSHFKTTDKDNEKYLSLCIFMNEKVSDPTITVSNKMKTDLSLNKKQVKQLNDMDIDRVHEIININNPKIRSLFLLNEYSTIQETLLKEIDNAHTLLETKNNTGEYLKTVPIINMTSNLENKIKVLSPQMKDIVNIYLNTFTNGTGKCNVDIMESLEKTLNKNGNLIVAMNSGLKSNLVNLDNAESKNVELDYTKKVGGWLVGSKDEITKINQKVREMIVNQSNDLNCTGYKRYITENPTISEKLHNTTVTALQKIGKLRDSIKEKVGISSTPTI